jgi:uncharacterized protein (TIGR03435 family)
VKSSAGAVPSDPQKPYCGALLSDRSGHFTGVSATMTQLASVMSRRLGRPVIDQTQLEGAYDLEIEYVPGLSAVDTVSDSSGGGSGISIFTAFQDQLGLKLQASTRPVDVFVIDRIERPTAD